MTAYWCERAWVGDTVASSVVVETDGGRIASVATAPPPPDAVRLGGLVIPGLANAHSHAFHRALRGRTQSGTGDFWTWRDRMYEVAGRLEPDTYFDLARAVYCEMALAGITTVGEFHYLHHRPDGGAYADPNAMGAALLAAAGEAGIRITLLDACYLRAGFDREPEGVQQRFSDGSAQAWAERVDALAAPGHARLGAAIHSVRAVDEAAAAVIAAAAGGPLHFHLSEQRAENEAALAHTGRTPTALLADAGAIGPRSTAVHATHVSAADIALLGGSFVCMCPTTERDLADGIGPAPELRAAGTRLAFGTDSHAVIDMFEEARAVELDERLRSGRRGTFPPAALLAAATVGGMASLGWDDAGAIAVGNRADLVAVDLESVRTAGGDAPPATVVFAATAADVTDVVADGRTIVREGRHTIVEDVPRALSRALRTTMPG